MDEGNYEIKYLHLYQSFLYTQYNQIAHHFDNKVDLLVLIVHLEILLIDVDYTVVMYHCLWQLKIPRDIFLVFHEIDHVNFYVTVIDMSLSAQKIYQLDQLMVQKHIDYDGQESNWKFPIELRVEKNIWYLTYSYWFIVIQINSS